MKKIGSRTTFDLAISDFSETKIIPEQKLPDFINFSKEEGYPVQQGTDIRLESMNQSWSLPDRTYRWFPYFMMHLTSK